MKYNSTFYNNEKYYDPTAGAALLNIIREERQNRRSNRAAIQSNVEQDDESIRERQIERFVYKFCKHYRETHPPRKSGKPLRYEVPKNVRKHIQIYEYCMEHCNDDNFSIEQVVKHFNLGTDRRVKQCFSKNGQIGKLIKCWNSYLAFGKFEWGSIDGGGK